MRSALIATIILLASTADVLALWDPKDGAAGDRISMQLVQSAKFVFPLPVLFVTRNRYPDGRLIYVITLDARKVSGAPAPVIASEVRLPADPRMDMIERTLRAASADVSLLLQLMRSPDLIGWNQPTPRLAPLR